jgi:hypothetical protein
MPTSWSGVMPVERMVPASNSTLRSRLGRISASNSARVTSTSVNGSGSGTSVCGCRDNASFAAFTSSRSARWARRSAVETGRNMCCQRPGSRADTWRPTCSSSAWSTSNPPRSGSPASARTANPFCVAPTIATSNVPAPRS